MVSVILNPYQGIDWTKQYKANLHTHTTNSDGSIATLDVVAAYNNANYDILAITDHDYFTDWAAPGGMLKIPSREVTLSIPHVNALFAGNSAYTNSLAVTLDEVEANGGISIINHIGRLGYTASWWADVFDDSWNTVAAEVLNQGDRYSTDRQLWDSIHDITLSRYAGKRVIWGVSNDDMHAASHQFHNYNFFIMEDLTESALKKALKKGSFYFCYEPNGNGSPQVPLISNIVVSANSISITASNVVSVSWFNSYTVIGTGLTLDLSTVPIGAKYVRAKLSNDYGSTYTQPFLLDDGLMSGKGNSMVLGNCMGIGQGFPVSLQAVSDKLIAWYDCLQGPNAQILYDKSGNGHHGQLGSAAGSDSNDPTWTAEGLQFNGSQYIKLPAAIMQVLDAGQATLEIAFKAATLTDGSLYTLLCGMTDGGNTKFALTRNGDNKLEIFARIVSADTGALKTTDDLFKDVASYHHISSIMDVANDTASIKMDGVVKAVSGTCDFVQSSFDGSGGITWIGIKYDGVTSGFIGKIADIKIYNKGLSSAEQAANRAYLIDSLAKRSITLP